MREESKREKSIGRKSKKIESSSLKERRRKKFEREGKKMYEPFHIMIIIPTFSFLFSSSSFQFLSSFSLFLFLALFLPHFIFCSFGKKMEEREKASQFQICKKCFSNSKYFLAFYFSLFFSLFLFSLFLSFSLSLSLPFSFKTWSKRVNHKKQAFPQHAYFITHFSSLFLLFLSSFSLHFFSLFLLQVQFFKISYQKTSITLMN